jgi:hypothetical protein
LRSRLAAIVFLSSGKRAGSKKTPQTDSKSGMTSRRRTCLARVGREISSRRERIAALIIRFGFADCRHATVAMLSAPRSRLRIAGIPSKMKPLGSPPEATSKCSAGCSAHFAQPTENQERWRPVVEHRPAIHLVFDDSRADPANGPPFCKDP